MALTLKLQAKTTGSTAAGKTVGLPLCPSSFFGSFAGAPLIKIFWDAKNPDKSIRKAYTVYETDSWKKYDKDHVKIDEGEILNSSDWAPTHEYASEGANKIIKVLGGYAAAAGSYAGGKLAFSQTSTQTDGVAEIDDQRAEDSTPEKITKILKCAKDGFYVHGQGDFAMFTGLIQAIGLRTACMLKSADPAAAIEMIKAGSRGVLMNHTFYNTPNYTGKAGLTQNELQPWGKKLQDSGVADSASLKSAQSTFEDSGFNGTVKAWDFSAVTSLLNMFKDAVNFTGRGVGRMLNPNRGPDGKKANPKREFLDLGDIGGFLQGCANLQIKRAKKLKNWDVGNVTRITNFLGGTTINVKLDMWNCNNVTTGTLGGNATSPALPSATFPDALAVTLTDAGAAIWDGDETPADDYTKSESPAAITGWSLDQNGIDVTSWEDEVLTYYAQDDPQGQDVNGFWLIIGPDNNQFLLVDADDDHTMDLSDSLLSWDGNNDYINVADIDE